MKKLLILFIVSVSLGNLVTGEILHLERYLEGGKSFVRVIVPEIYQTDSGIVVYTAIATDSGPTFFDKWFVKDHTVAFPTLGIHQRIDLPFWTGDEERPEGTLIFVGAQNYFDSGEPVHPNNFLSSRNGGWVDSHTLGWINILHYPWIYRENFGWTYVMQTDPVWHGMAWWGYSLEKGWVYFAESAPNTIFHSGTWKAL